MNSEEIYNNLTLSAITYEVYNDLKFTIRILYF